MIRIGIDAVDIERFSQWSSYNKTKLKRIFSEAEIAYCLSNPSKAAERFAVRFAAKEAFYKAIASSSEKPIPFLLVCKQCELIKNAIGMPIMKANWPALLIKESYSVQLSLTHTRLTAIAAIIIQSDSHKI